jgi:hypothetical protein
MIRIRGDHEGDRWLGDRRSPKGLATEEATAYWDRLRFLQQKSARARKRAEER